MTEAFLQTMRSELARVGVTEATLAKQIGISPSTLSGWTAGRGPSNAGQRITDALAALQGTAVQS